MSDRAIEWAARRIRSRVDVTEVPRDCEIRAPGKYKDKSCVEVTKKANHGCKARWTNTECFYYNVSGVHVY